MCHGRAPARGLFDTGSSSAAILVACPERLGHFLSVHRSTPACLPVLLLFALGSCAPRVQDSASLPESRATFSFARDALRFQERPDDALLRRLEASPELAALLRHRRLSGDRSVTAHELLTRVLAAAPEDGTRAVLDRWQLHEAELIAAADRSAHYLPPGHDFGGQVHFVIGYDIAVAAPPDVAINAAHAHFREQPEEVAHYVTHEAHHVGFLSLRTLPSLERLREPGELTRLVHFLTQMEGMAVHSVYEPRRDAGHLGADDDYRLYEDPEEAARVTRRYAEVLALAGGTETLADETIGQVLEAMSSGERLGYRFGALASWTLERDEGRDALVSSVADPRVFRRKVDELLAAAR